MAEFTVIPDQEAPKRAKTSGKLTSRMREFEGYLDKLKKNQVGKLTPEAGESARGLALRISRAAKRREKEIETWVVDGVTYFKHR